MNSKEEGSDQSKNNNKQSFNMTVIAALLYKDITHHPVLLLLPLFQIGFKIALHDSLIYGVTSALA